jgi:hypothetical protein
MNRAAQTFLGLAIAIIFPLFAFYAAVTFVPAPAPKTIPYPTPPEQPFGGAPECAQSLKGAANGATTPCDQLRMRYEQQQLDYQQQERDYQNSLQTYDKLNQTEAAKSLNTDVYRALVGLIIAILGLAAIALVVGIPSLVYGLAAGAGLTLLAATTAMLSSGSETTHPLQGLTLLVLFVLLVVMGVVFERRFKFASTNPHDSHSATNQPHEIVVPDHTTDTPPDHTQAGTDDHQT